MLLRHRRTGCATAVALAVGALALAACGSSGSSSSSSGPTVAAGSVAPVLTSTGQPVPKPLDELEAQSEDLIDIVPGGKWDQVAGDVTSIDTAWAAYQPQGTTDGAPAAVLSGMATAVGALDAASHAQDPTGTMQAANDLSAGVVELYGLYDLGRPVGIGRLDVIGRQIVLDAAAKDQAKVQQQIAAATAQVAALESDLADHDGKKVIDQSHDLLTAMTDAAATQDYAPVTHTTITQNWLDGAGCTVNTNNKPLPTMTGVTLTTNRFGRNHRYVDCAVLSQPGVTLTTSGNVWDDTGLPARLRLNG